MSDEIVLAIIGALQTIALAFIAYLNRRHDNENARKREANHSLLDNK